MKKDQLDAFIIILGRLIWMVAALISIRVLTSLLAPVEIGRMTIFMTIIGFFGLFMLNPIGMFVNRQIIGWRRRGLLKINLIYLMLYILAVSIIAVFVMSLLRPFMIFDGQAAYYEFISIIFLGVLITSLQTAFISYINFFKMRLAFVLLSNLSAWAALLFSTLLVLFLAKKAELWLLGQFSSQMIFFLVSLYILLRLSKASGHQEKFRIYSLHKFKNVLHFSVPLSLSVLFYWLQTQGYRFILQYKYGLEILGIFFVVFNIGAQLLLAFETMFNQFYHPIFYNTVSTEDVSKRTNAWNAFAEAFLPALTLTLLFIASSGAILIKIFVPRFYWPFSYLLFFGALVEGLRVFNTAYSMAAHAEYKTSSLLLPSIVAGITSIALVYFLPAINLFYGVAAALTLAGLLGLWILRIEIKKIMPIKFPMIRTFKVIIYSLPLFLGLGVFYWLNLGGYYWNFAFILIMGGYYLLGQYLLARNWIRESL